MNEQPMTMWDCAYVTPRGKEYLPFQKEGIKQMMYRKHNLLADEMGLGKTIQAIGLINVCNLHKTLIVCKASIKRNWQHKLNEWLTTRRVIQIIDKKTDYVSDLTEIAIVNYDLITHSYLFNQLIDIKWDLLVCDEAHALKNLKAKRTVAVLAKNGLAHHAKRTLMMTGTPILNRPVELFPILKVLAPQVIAPYSDYYRYAKRYCDAWQDGFCFNDKGASNVQELNTKLRQHYMIRRLTHEVEVQLPKKRYEMVFIDSNRDIQDKLRILDQANRKDFKHQNFTVDAGGLATLRRETAEEKINQSIDLIKEYIESAGKLVIFAYHHSVIEKLEKELQEYGTKVLHGGVPQSERQRRIDDFINGKNNRVFIGQIQAAGEGIDGLQTCCNTVLFVEWSWVPGEIEQACKRVHRIGQTRPVLIRFLVWADSIEEHMMRVALDKVKVIKELLK